MAISPNSNLPPAARRQVQEADRLANALKAGHDPNVLAAAPVVPAAPAAPAPGAAPNFPAVGVQLPADARPIAPAAPAAAPAAPAAPVPPADATAMPAAPDPEHKYKVLQGKYTAERQRDAARIRQLEENNNRLTAQLGTTPAAPVVPAAAPPVVTAEQRALNLGITKQELAEYGPELIELIIRTAANLTGPKIRELAAEQQRLSGAVQSSVAAVNRSARELVYDALESHVSNWATVNDSQEFLDWLDEVDIISGMTRRTGLMRAFEVNDATRVVGIFKTFIAEDERSRSTARTRQVDPATLIAPGTPAGGGSPAPLDGNQSGRIWLEAEVENFYALKRQGYFKHKLDEMKSMEAEIMAALAQGRIRPTINEQGLANAR